MTNLFEQNLLSLNDTSSVVVGCLSLGLGLLFVGYRYITSSNEVSDKYNSTGVNTDDTGQENTDDTSQVSTEVITDSPNQVSIGVNTIEESESSVTDSSV